MAERKARAPEDFLILIRGIREDLAVLERIYAELEPAVLDTTTSVDERILIGYRLHNVYNAFENIFREIARAFENRLETGAGWHAELLRRMRLDLTPIRPALIDADTFAKLDELRRFRHVFRSIYGVELDPVRMSVALTKARELREIWPAQIERFLAFLEELANPEPS